MPSLKGRVDADRELWLLDSIWRRLCERLNIHAVRINALETPLNYSYRENIIRTLKGTPLEISGIRIISEQINLALAAPLE